MGLTKRKKFIEDEEEVTVQTETKHFDPEIEEPCEFNGTVKCNVVGCGLCDNCIWRK